jgi:hypothetical protein
LQAFDHDLFRLDDRRVARERRWFLRPVGGCVVAYPDQEGGDEDDGDQNTQNRLGKAPIDTPRRAMGDQLGNAVRFGLANDVLVAGEGLETMLSLRCVLPTMPMAAALSASHLAALLLPPTLRRLYIACDADAAGMGAAAALTSRADQAGIEALVLSPRLSDFNEDLRALGLKELRAALCTGLTPQDVARFLP